VLGHMNLGLLAIAWPEPRTETLLIITEFIYRTMKY